MDGIISPLQTSVNLNSFDITTLNSDMLNRYTKNESNNRYYTQAQINTLASSFQDALSNEGSLGVDLYSNNKIRKIHGTNGISTALKF